MHANNVKETTTTTGTGTVTLASASGFARFSAAFPVGAVVSYGIKTASGDWEWGLGVVGASNTLARSIVLATLVSGTYTRVGASALSLTGTSEVFCVEQADSPAGVAMPNVTSLAAQRMVLPQGLEAAASNRTMVANVPRASCLLWNCSAAITHLVCEVTTASGSGSDRIQTGVYACAPDGGIGALLFRSGDMDPSSTGVKSSAIVGGSVRLPPGWYWFAIASNVTPGVRAWAGGSPGVAPMPTPMGHGSGGLQFRNGGAALTTLGGGWTALDASTSLVSLATVNAEFAPTVATLVA